MTGSSGVMRPHLRGSMGDRGSSVSEARDWRCVYMSHDVEHSSNERYAGSGNEVIDVRGADEHGV